MRVITTTITLLIILATTSCSRIYGDNSYFANRDSAYLKAKSLPPLNIPPGLDSSSIRSDYPIADAQYNSSAKDVSLMPPELS